MRHALNATAAQPAGYRDVHQKPVEAQCNIFVAQHRRIRALSYTLASQRAASSILPPLWRATSPAWTISHLGCCLRWEASGFRRRQLLSQQ